MTNRQFGLYIYIYIIWENPIFDGKIYSFKIFSLEPIMILIPF